ncbi:MAG: AAA-associated domain-containing protein [Candidatus Binataceae bacterium]
MVADIYRQLAADIVHVQPAAARAEAGAAYRLPPAGVQRMLGLIDAIDDPPFAGKASFGELADHEALEMDQLLVLVQGLKVLGFAGVTDTAIELTDAGRAFHAADVQERKGIFARHLIKYVPLIRRIMQVLEEQTDNRARETRILTELEGQLSEEDAQEAFTTAVNWARYAELFSYDYDSGILSLESPADQA